MMHMRATELPFVSIVICTLNRKNMLKKCLDTIFRLDYPKSKYEVIVVDGGSTDGTADLKDDFPTVKFITESKLGLAHARNVGAKNARGSIIAYTDDDCIVDAQWLRNLIYGFHSPLRVIGVGGPIYPLNPEIIPKKFLVKAALGLFDDGEYIKIADRGIITSNCAFRKEAFNVAKFDEQFGVTRRGGLLLSGEDVDFCLTLRKTGYKLLYTPYAKVYHNIPAYRVRGPYILKHAFFEAISNQRRILKWECANLRGFARIRALRYIIGQIVQSSFSFLRHRSLPTCYGLIVSLTTLLVCLTFLDRLVF